MLMLLGRGAGDGCRTAGQGFKATHRENYWQDQFNLMKIGPTNLLFWGEGTSSERVIDA
jgi:hypothetical protein